MATVCEIRLVHKALLLKQLGMIQLSVAWKFSRAARYFGGSHIEICMHAFQPEDMRISFETSFNGKFVSKVAIWWSANWVVMENSFKATDVGHWKRSLQRSWKSYLVGPLHHLGVTAASHTSAVNFLCCTMIIQLNTISCPVRHWSSCCCSLRNIKYCCRLWVIEEPVGSKVIHYILTVVNVVIKQNQANLKNKNVKYFSMYSRAAILCIHATWRWNVLFPMFHYSLQVGSQYTCTFLD